MVSQDFAKNVLLILRHNNIKIGEFEKNHGMSTGYLSRIAKGDNRSVDFNVAWDISNELDIDLEDIVLTDWVKVFEEDDKKKRIESLLAEQKRIEEELASLNS